MCLRTLFLLFKCNRPKKIHNVKNYYVAKTIQEEHVVMKDNLQELCQHVRTPRNSVCCLLLY